MKLRSINLESASGIASIRPGQMFQVESLEYGNFKDYARKSEKGWIYFLTPKNYPITLFDVQNLYVLDYLAK